MIEDAFVEIVTDDAAIAAMIGDRIGPRPMPAGTAYPFITYSTISGKENNHQGGAGKLIDERFQFDIYDPDFDTVRDLRKKLRDCLNGYRGDKGDVQIRTCVRHLGPHFEEPESAGSENMVHRQSDDYTFGYLVA